MFSHVQFTFKISYEGVGIISKISEFLKMKKKDKEMNEYLMNLRKSS